MSRVDIHFHILPGVDDGPADLSESIELAAAAAAEGTGTIVATSHLRADMTVDVGKLADGLAELRHELARAEIEIELRLGAELGHTMVSRLSQSELETVALGPRGARWLLVETPFDGLRADFTAATDELRERGFAVVLAHPERAGGEAASRDGVLQYERQRGTVYQLNAWSLAGRHGGEARIRALAMLADGEPVVIASDAHGGWRMPALELGVHHAVANGFPRAAAERLVSSVPGRLIEQGVATPLPVG